MEKYYTYIRWGLLAVISLGFLYEGAMKVFGQSTAEFVAWGFPAWSVYVVGGFQLLGAFGLFHHKTVSLALFIISVILIVAILTLAGKHLFFPRMIYPILYLLGIFGLMYLKAKRTEEEPRWGLL